MCFWIFDDKILNSPHFWGEYYYPPSTTLKGDIETVSVRPFIIPSIRLFVWKESSLTATIFHRSLPNLYSSCHGNHFSFSPLMHIYLCLFLTWKHEGTFLSNFYNIFIKVQLNFSAIFSKFWQKLLPWQPFHFALFVICSLQKW